MKRDRQFTLRDVIALQRGYDLTEAQRQPGNVPVIGSAGVHGYHNVARAKAPGITLGRSGGSFGKVTYVQTDFWPHNTTIFVTDFKGNEPAFVRYLLETLDFSPLNSGSAQQSLNRNYVYTVPVRKFSRAEQIKVAAILSAYDELIENNRQRIALLEKLAEEIYREWFVRLRFPGHEKVKKVKGVPDEWKIRKLGSILELCYGKALKDDHRIPGEFPVYGSSGVVGTHNEALVKTSGLIVGRKGNVGSVFWSDTGFFPIDTVYFVKSELPNSFLYFLLRSMNFINNDAAVPGLNRSQACSNQFFLPPTPLIKEYANLADSQFEMKRVLTKQNDKLTETRDKLLPRLISGKLSVENLDIQFPPGMAKEL